MSILPPIDALISTLGDRAATTLITGQYPIPVLRYLAQSLTTLTFEPEPVALLSSSTASTGFWDDLFPIHIAVQRYRLALTPTLGAPGQSAFFCGWGRTCGFVLGVHLADHLLQKGDAALVDVTWSCDPAALSALLDSVEQVLCTSGAEQEAATLQQLRGSSVLQLPSPAQLQALSGTLLGFAARQQQCLASTVDALEQRSRWQEDQIMLLVHDIRAPLHTLAMSIKAMLIPHMSAADRQELLQMAQDRVQYLFNLTETAMDTARLEVDQWVLHRQPVEVSMLLQAVCEPFIRVPLRDQPNLGYSAAADLPVIHVDRVLIERVLTNLLMNALKHTPATGEVRLSAQLSAEAQAIELLVSDTGSGIALEDQTHIFNRFYQAISGQRHLGVGLGLYFCRLAVEAHGGTISVISTPGVGSTFRVQLPISSV